MKAIAGNLRGGRIESGYFIALTVIVLALCSVPAFGTRFLNDMDFYALFADKLISGGVLYRDAMDVKPPLVFLHYGMLFKLFGLNNMTAVKFVTIGWLGLSATIMMALHRALSPTAAMPTRAALLFILASFSGWGQDFLSSNTEILANLFILAGAFLLAKKGMGRRLLQLVLGGACIGVAFLYRYQSGVALAAYTATILVKRRQFDHKIVRLLLVSAGFVVPQAIFILYYSRIGALNDLRLFFACQTHYARDADLSWPAVLRQISLTVCGLWPLLVLAAWQAVAILRKHAQASPREIFQVAFAICSTATFFLGGHLYPHYFVQAIPALVLLAADRLETFQVDIDSHSKPLQRWFAKNAVAIMVTVAVVFAGINATYFWTRETEPSRRDLVAFVDAHSRSNDEVLLWTWRPELLFQTKRTFATRQLASWPLIGRRGAVPGLWSAFLHDLAASPPKLIFDAAPGQSQWPISQFPQLEPFLGNYHPCQIIDGICVYLRKG